MWNLVNYGSWIVSGLLVLWMLWDWYQIDSSHSEAELTSSREGEIEAVSEKHKI